MPELTPNDIARLRDETPGCAHVCHLNNAGSALMPSIVVEAMKRYLDVETMTGGYEAAADEQPAIVAAYEALARLLGTRTRNVAVVENATVGFAQAMSSFAFEPGDVIVTSRNDYISNQLLYLSLQRRSGVVIRRAEDLPSGGVDPESVRDLVRQGRCRVVAITWVPTNSGLVQDIQGVSDVCEAEGVSLVVDACQAVGQLPIDVSMLRCDFLSATARKFLRGPRGIGFLYVSDRALERGAAPLFPDMRGAMWTGVDRYELVPDARRFENWEFAYALLVGLGAAARYASKLGVKLAGDRAAALAARLRSGMRGIAGVEVLDRGAEQCAIATIRVGTRDGQELHNALRERGINTSVIRREHALIDMTEKGATSGLRLSPHYYNTEAEVDAAVGAIEELVQR